MEHGSTVRKSEHRDVVMQVLWAALDAADPYRAVLNALRERDLSHITGDIYVLGAGKAGAAMCRAAEEVLGMRLAGGLVIVKDGHVGDAALERIEIVEASHPVPDQRGVEATGRLLELANRAGENDLVLCLISGGGSALMPAPADGLSLQDIQQTTQALLRAGATINELNAVRKHLSRISGGRLARAAAPARVLSLVLSDVTASPLDVIASGPTAPDPTTFQDALGVLARYGLSGDVPPSVLERLQAGARGDVEETPKPHDPLFACVENAIVASNVIAVEAAAAKAWELGLDTVIMSTYVEGEASEVGLVLAGVAKEIATYSRPVTRPGCVLFGGETTVTVRGYGVGGRNTELALSAAVGIGGMGPGVLVASLATDGGDGSSPSAGAIVDGTTIAEGEALGLNHAVALANNDSYTYLSQVGDALMLGPTGTNVNDIMAVFVF
ncbi:MAG: glycerate kinase [Chloroflexota bacterium]|nr:glycerate kinase [Chloroflexota bacterium]MDQ5867110.1 glycerate kinase [Chloroflexota bacterium]